MADKKITELTAFTTPTDDDLLIGVDNPGGSPETKKIAWANIKATLKTYLDTLYRPISEVDGWIAVNETWAFASSTSFTVSTDLTTKYTPGVKIKCTNNTLKYFYVVSSTYGAPNTTVTITGGSSYTLAATAITSPYYSRVENPLGFPQWFAYTPTIVGYSVVPPVSRYRFSISGRTVHVVMREGDGGLGTSNSTLTSYSLPVAGANSMYPSVRITTLVDNGVTKYGGIAIADAGTTKIDVYTDANGTAWTASGGKSAFYASGFEMFYEI